MHQEPFKRVSENLGIQVEVVEDSSHTLVNILTTMGWSRVALSLKEAIMDPIKRPSWTLWQIAASFPYSHED